MNHAQFCRSRRSAAALALATLCCLCCSEAVRAEHVELVVVTPSSESSTASHEWMRMLGESQFDLLRFKTGGRSPRPKIDIDKQGGRTVYQVTAVLTRGRLHLPGASFSRSQSRQIGEWFDRVADHADRSGPKHAFGMNADQLLYLHKLLKEPVLTPTEGTALPDLVSEISRELPIDLTARTRPPRDEITESLEGLSIGTALAAALRPSGLVLVPVRLGTSTSDVGLEIRSVKSADEIWPVGWPPEQRIKQLAPKLLDFLEVEINDVPLEEALTALAGRLELPLLFDQNGMARQDIDPATAKVSFPARKTFYKKIVNNLLYQAKLKSELRVDEAGNPFLWIAPVKRN